MTANVIILTAGTTPRPALSSLAGVGVARLRRKGKWWRGLLPQLWHYGLRRLGELGSLNLKRQKLGFDPKDENSGKTFRSSE